MYVVTSWDDFDSETFAFGKKSSFDSSVEGGSEAQILEDLQAETASEHS